MQEVTFLEEVILNTVCLSSEMCCIYSLYNLDIFQDSKLQFS